MLKILDTTRSCPTCTYPILSITTVYPLAEMEPLRHVPRDAIHNGHPLHYAACKHSDETPSITVSKVGSDKSITMMETLETSPAPLDIQYDSGCQFRLISKSTLLLLPSNTYSLGNSAKINLLDFTSQGQLFGTT